MNRRLYVGNLALGTLRASIEGMFSAVGTVEAVVVPTTPGSRRSRGFAFVTMGSAGEAESARSRLDGALLDGRSLRVSEVVVPTMPAADEGLAWR